MGFSLMPPPAPPPTRKTTAKKAIANVCRLMGLPVALIKAITSVSILAMSVGHRDKVDDGPSVIPNGDRTDALPMEAADVLQRLAALKTLQRN